MLLLLFLLGVAVLSVVRYLYVGKQRSPGLPPGPPGLPIIGNILQSPTTYPWRVYHQWGKKYGPIFTLQMAQNTIIMLGSHQTANDLLNKRSNIYSSRPRMVMAGECLGHGMLTLLMPYGPRWRAHQRLQMSCLSKQVSTTYYELQEMESKHLFGFSLAYGKRLTDIHEPDLKELDIIVENTLTTLIPGAWVVDTLPFLNILPKWLASWKKYADRLHNFESAVYLKNSANAIASSSWNWCKQVESLANGAMSHEELAYDIGIMYEVSSDTTTIAFEVFTLAALLHPNAVQKAQAELDRVVGLDRLPNFGDKNNLPYIHAFANEVLRWRPVAAGGVPHAVTEDDEYMGYHIPKGATVIANHWAICQDESVYDSPELFNPDRWIENPNLPLATFGHGRRTCFGQHVARNSMFIIIARLLWAFDIDYSFEEKSGHKVRLIPDPMAMTQGFNSKPMPFKANFKPRSPHMEDVVRREWDVEEKDVSVILNRVQKAQAAQKHKA
ncbi:related to cytochrome P450 CYP2 subfamily [Phialocephala subalpina]|uniref:Related to cytochrome P450 CYP2 subfamily n=1 Tax=Phialocephala subalpina TaxID=576137 RepID=A0A1L7XKZ0_9HELO|nr:related to cytochrome P450 CYP2 subfamily [Phialocephala subalpina]